jgi:hypothetical protein
MKLTAWLVGGAAVIFLAYTLAPDFVRYMKIRNM